MPRTKTEASQARTSKVTRLRNLDIPKIHGNDYTTINNNPNVLWNFWQKEEAILGSLAGTERNPWYAAYPGVQYVGNRPESTHIVIAPRRDHFVTPSDLVVEDTAQAAVFIQRFLRPRHKQAYAGYNVGPEKDGSQMWWTWHIHLVRFDEGELIDIANAPRIIWEPWPDQVNDVLEYAFVTRLLSEDRMPQAEQVGLSTLDRFGFASYGSILLRFDPNISPQELATVMCQADREYKQFHGELKEIFFDEKETSAFRKRDPEDMITRLKKYAETWAIPDKAVFPLAIFGEGLPESLPETPTRTSPLKLPNYSAAILRDEQGTYFLFQPHIFRKKASALSSLGIFLDYTLNIDPQSIKDYGDKKARSAQLVKEINASLHPFRAKL